MFESCQTYVPVPPAPSDTVLTRHDSSISTRAKRLTMTMDTTSWSLIRTSPRGVRLPSPLHTILTYGSPLTPSTDQMMKLLGQGTFGKVVQARDRRRSKLVAIKIIRSVQKYRDASRIELRVLATLKANDEENRNRCIHLRDCFDYRGHICIVMDLLGQSVFDFLKSNSFVPFPNSQIQSFARQLFTSVACKFLDPHPSPSIPVPSFVLRSNRV